MATTHKSKAVLVAREAMVKKLWQQGRLTQTQIAAQMRLMPDTITRYLKLLAARGEIVFPRKPEPILPQLDLDGDDSEADDISPKELLASIRHARALSKRSQPATAESKRTHKLVMQRLAQVEADVRANKQSGQKSRKSQSKGSGD